MLNHCSETDRNVQKKVERVSGLTRGPRHDLELHECQTVYADLFLQNSLRTVLDRLLDAIPQATFVVRLFFRLVAVCLCHCLLVSVVCRVACVGGGGGGGGVCGGVGNRVLACRSKRPRDPPRKKHLNLYRTLKKNFCVQLVRPPVFHQGGLGLVGVWFGGGPGGNGPEKRGLFFLFFKFLRSFVEFRYVLTFIYFI